MNNIKELTAKQSDLYISDIWKKLPYGIIDKGVTGCGATTLPLESKENVIVCVPLVQLIKNKVIQYPNKRVDYTLQGVYSGITEKEINEHIALEQPKKFICTYDSFIRLINTIGDITEYSIIVDEYSELLSTYKSRQENIEPFIDVLQTLDKVSYISATPLKPEYLPLFMKNKESYKIDWTKTVYNTHKEMIFGFTTKPKVTAKNLIVSFLEKGYVEVNEHKADELFIFINSVSLIVDIVKSMKLPNELYKVICGVSDENKEKLKIIDAKIDTDFMQNKKINFITSTAFLGCDFYSENGLKIVVTDVRKRFSMLDVNTQIKQIEGRIRTRTNPFNNLVIHFTNCKNWNEDTLTIINNNLKDSQDWVNSYSTALDGVKKQAQKLAKEEDLYLKYNSKTDKLSIDDIKYKADFMKQSTFTLHYLKKDDLLREYEKEGFIYNFYLFRESETIKNYIQNKKKADYYEMYNIFKNDHYNFTKILIDNEVRTYDKQIPEEVNTLGIQKIRALKYSKPKIRIDMIFESKEFKQAVLELIREQIITKEYYSTNEIKTLLNSIYTQLKIKKTAKATDIIRYVNTTQKRIKSNTMYILDLDEPNF